jgi:RNA polymerase sigma-70 factor (ECF subfamily)
MTGPTWDVASEGGFMSCYRATFDEVYRYTAMLCGTDRALAEDVVQDTYMSALASARAGQLASCSVGYLVIAARHRFLDRVRAAAREDRRLRLVTSVPEEPVVAVVPPQLSDLPDRERAALVLRYVDDFTVAQVGSELGISTHAAESLLARATRRLRHQEVRDA